MHSISQNSFGKAKKGFWLWLPQESHKVPPKVEVLKREKRWDCDEFRYGLLQTTHILSKETRNSKKEARDEDLEYSRYGGLTVASAWVSRGLWQQDETRRCPCEEMSADSSSTWFVCVICQITRSEDWNCKSQSIKWRSPDVLPLRHWLEGPDPFHIVQESPDLVIDVYESSIG